MVVIDIADGNLDGVSSLQVYFEINAEVACVKAAPPSHESKHEYLQRPKTEEEKNYEIERGKSERAAGR